MFPNVLLKSRLLVFIALMGVTATSLADTRYVIDELSVNMRKGKGTDFAITAILKSGDSVAVLGDDRSGYSKVRTSEGKVGYILTRFLSREPTGKVQAERLQALLEAEQQKVVQLDNALTQARTGSEQSQKENAAIAEERDKLQARLNWIEEASANTVKIADENQSLREKILVMESEVTTLRQENREMKTWHRGQRVGAVILVTGIFLGWLFGRFRKPGSAWSGDRL